MNSQAGKRLKSPAVRGACPPSSGVLSEPSSGTTLNPAPLIPVVIPKWAGSDKPYYNYFFPNAAGHADWDRQYVESRNKTQASFNYLLANLYKGKWK